MTVSTYALSDLALGQLGFDDAERLEKPLGPEMRIAYFGYDFFFECMRRLAAKHEIVALFTFRTDNVWDFNTRVLDEAQKKAIPIYMSKPTETLIEWLVSQGCELLVSAAYAFKIPTLASTGAPLIRGINLHPTLLPTGRGRWPLPWLILRTPEAAGITIHKLSSRFDEGDILIQEPVTLGLDDDLETLSLRLQVMAPTLIENLIDNIDARWETARPQEPGGSYWAMPSDDDRMLNWNLSVHQNLRIARAFSKHEAAAILNGKRWIVTRANGWIERHYYAPGTIVHETAREMLVAASDGYICLQEFAPVRWHASFP